MTPRPFHVHVQDAVLADLRDRLARVRWPDEAPGPAWSYGTSLEYMKELVAYWRDSYDWRKHEARLNEFRQFTTPAAGITLHFIHEEGRGSNPLPLLLSHGWPGSIWEFRKLIPLLVDPARFGGDPADAFTVVAPSLPGYGFSFRPNQPRFGIVEIADLFAALMTDVLGYRRFGAHGGDWGCLVTARLGVLHADHVVGLHVTNLFVRAAGTDAATFTAEERAYFEAVQRWQREEGGYQAIQGTKPQTLAYALTDSPVGLAAWLVEKYRAWSDCGGDVERRFTKDELLTAVMLYWVTGAINSSFWPYYWSRHAFWSSSPAPGQSGCARSAAGPRCRPAATSPPSRSPRPSPPTSAPSSASSADKSVSPQGRGLGEGRRPCGAREAGLHSGRHPHTEAPMPHRLALLALSCLVALVALAGRPAPAAEEVVVYSSVDEENAKKLLDAFTKATGVQVRFTFLSSGPAVARLEAERANPRADVWFGAPSENHVAAKEKGLTQPYVSPNAKELDPKFRDKEGYWTSFYMNPLGLGVNTKALKDRGAPVPTSWEDLLRPEFRNQIQLPSPQTSGTGYNMVAALVQMWGEDKAFDYLKRLHPNVQTYTQSGTAPSKAAAIGQAVIGIQFTPAFLQLADEGYPLQLVFPKEGVGFEAPAISIVKGAPHPEAAKKLVDWFLTLPAQNALTDAKTYFFPVHPKAKLAKGLPSFDQIPVTSYDAVWAGQNKKRLVDRWIAEVLRAPK